VAAFSRFGLESLQLEAHGVDARGQRREPVDAAAVGHAARLPGHQDRAADRDGDAGDDGAPLVEGT
jgi:hypothetical protein